MTPETPTAWWDRLTELAANGPKPGEEAEAEEFIAAAEKMTAAAKALMQPRALTPAKAAQLMRYPRHTPAGQPVTR